ncbi:MAG: ferritin-like domain-containing protein [Actinomycetota bacterium]|nr:ferritin-like domain-containing protein [Actinomycetota bacterium]
MPISRRALLSRGAFAAGAAAIPASLVSVETALAQEDEQTDALERLIALERAAELALSLAAEDSKLDADAKTAFEELSRQNGEHTTALEQALESLGVDPPETQSDQEDFDSLDNLDLQAAQDELIQFMIDLESELLGAYEEETTNFDAGDLFRTAAQVGASHAQHVVVLRLLAGEPPAALTELPAPASQKGE